MEEKYEYKDINMAYTEDYHQGFIHTYNQFPVVMDHGEGVYLYDAQGRKYLDFTSGYAVNSLGYNVPELNGAMKAQIDKLWHVSNLYYNEVAGKASLALLRVSGMDKLFFTNSGGEAVEGALKAARKYGSSEGKYKVIAMNNSFHGRSMGALSVTGNSHYREAFEPLVPGVSFGELNNIDSVKELMDDETCCVIVEPVQGEGGINCAGKEFMIELRQLCDQYGALLIADEVQCGMGRSGRYFAWQKLGVKPDILTMAKAIGSGFPVGAFAITDKVAEKSLQPGDHGSTFGGNPLAATAVLETVKLFQKKMIPEHVEETGKYLEEKLDSIAGFMDMVKERRGYGLMQGIKVSVPVNLVVNEALEQGLLIIGAGKDVIRFVPPLVIQKEHVDEMMEKLVVSLEKAAGQMTV